MNGAEGQDGGIGRVAVIMPTYNERENIEAMAARVRAAVPGADLLVVDDNSPDGTGELADKLAAGDGQVQVLHRPGKGGLGAAYIAGFQWALARDYGVMVEMDADGSHQPEELPQLLAALAAGADLVLGSRWVPGGTVQNWPKSREFLSRGANIYARVALGIKIGDATGGYRAYRASTLRRIGLAEIQSQGYCFQVDLVLRTLQAGLTVTEVPITFVERVHGASKMSRAVMMEAFWRIAAWGISGRWQAIRGQRGRSQAAGPAAGTTPPAGTPPGTAQPGTAQAGTAQAGTAQAGTAQPTGTAPQAGPAAQAGPAPQD